jgi:hypothetical protein
MPLSISLTGAMTVSRARSKEIGSERAVLLRSLFFVMMPF